LKYKSILSVFAFLALMAAVSPSSPTGMGIGFVVNLFPSYPLTI